MHNTTAQKERVARFREDIARQLKPLALAGEDLSFYKEASKGAMFTIHEYEEMFPSSASIQAHGPVMVSLRSPWQKALRGLLYG